MTRRGSFAQCGVVSPRDQYPQLAARWPKGTRTPEPGLVHGSDPRTVSSELPGLRRARSCAILRHARERPARSCTCTAEPGSAGVSWADERRWPESRGGGRRLPIESTQSATSATSRYVRGFFADFLLTIGVLSAPVTMTPPGSAASGKLFASWFNRMDGYSQRIARLQCCASKKRASRSEIGVSEQLRRPGDSGGKSLDPAEPGSADSLGVMAGS